jgi:hypothetical protein
MARKRPDLDALFQRTEQPEQPEQAVQPAPLPAAPSGPSPDIPATGRTLPTGVGLKESELAAIDEVAGKLGVARNALLRFAVRYFLAEYQAGRVSLEITPPHERRNRIKMP